MFLKKVGFIRLKKCLLFFLLLIVALVFSDSARIAYYHLWFNTRLLTLPLTPKKAQEVDLLLNQRFIYLDEGKSSQAFASEDGRYVIKLFKKRQEQSHLKKHIPFLRDFAAYRKRSRLHFQLYRSCLNAHQLLSHATGSIYYHLAPTCHFNKKVTLVNQNGSTSLLDLDKESYYIQKKAVIAQNLIEDSLSQGDIDLAKQAIRRVLDFSFLLYKQGVLIYDLELKNYGFIEDAAVKIDIEGLGYKKSRTCTYLSHYNRNLKRLRKWMVLHCPEDVLAFFDGEVENLFKRDKFTR